MAVEVKLDEKGRITLPKELRDRLGLKPGDMLVARLHGDRIVLEKSTDPFKVIGDILGSLSFSRTVREEAERAGAREAAERLHA
ncbi:AbrB/MazE/SpoVT family DNA-binding domain-containing protein [Pyrodictium abyssi]|uniref:SpoVT-AbrB domain-containing protein n=1 Tax=Pyrodictium abyssi TaxID=54256 RepID=A0ABM8IZ02_9CREN|nr:hypothetical protein PABY_23340 [Pyrodictium abyssi]